VQPVVEQDMDQIAGPLRADRRHIAQLHEGGTVAVEHDDRPVGVQSDAQGHGAGSAHRSDLIEMLGPVGQGEQLAPAEARGRDHRSLVGDSGQNAFQRLVPPGPRAARCQIDDLPRRCQRPRGLVQRLVAHGALRHDEGIGQLRLGHPVQGRIERRVNILGSVREGTVRNARVCQELRRGLAHKFVLGLVLQARLAAPGHHHQDRNAKRPVERGERVDGVAQARILAHHDAALARQPGPGGDRHGLPLAGRADIAGGGIADDPVDQRGQEAAWHPGIEAEAAPARRAQEIVRGNHGVRSRSAPGRDRRRRSRPASCR
jgi:hypothetical protein